MMNRIFSDAPNHYVFNSSKEENLIRDIFYQHWEKMKNQTVEITDQINRWREQSIAHINKHADQEIQILRECYIRQRNLFDESRRTNIDIATAYVHHGTKQRDLFDQLHEACKTLEFQVAKLEFIKDNMEYVKVITVEDNTKNKYEKSFSQQNTNINDDLYQNTNLFSSLAIANSDGTNRQSLAIRTSNNDDLWTDNNVNQKIYRTKDSDSNNKCPVCFMIYPSSMNHDDRSLHVSQHYDDDGN